MNKHKSNKIKENSNTVRHSIMGQITTTQNLVAIKEVRHAGQSGNWLAKWLIILEFIDLKRSKVLRRSNIAPVARIISSISWKINENQFMRLAHEFPPEEIHDDVIKWKHFPRYWPFVGGIHRSPVNSLHKGQWCGALMFSLICAWINSWVKQWWGWWFETPSRSLWRHCNERKNPVSRWWSITFHKCPILFLVWDPKKF